MIFIGSDGVDEVLFSNGRRKFDLFNWCFVMECEIFGSDEVDKRLIFTLNGIVKCSVFFMGAWKCKIFVCDEVDKIYIF